MLAKTVRPGDTVVWGQGPGAPTGLIEALLAERHRIGQFTTFSGYASGVRFDAANTDGVRFTALGAFGGLRALAAAGALEVIPSHMSDVAALFAQRRIRSDVVLVQVAPADDRGEHSLGIAVQHLPSAIAHARAVIAEVNDQLPVTSGYRLPADRIDVAIPVSRLLVEVPSTPPSARGAAIARHVAGLIPPEATLQLGVGSLPDGILAALHGREDLGFRTGLVTDALVDLVDASPQGRLSGEIVTGAAFGTRRLYEWLRDNSAVRVVGLDETHDLARLSAIPGFVSVNSAIEVDLTGQVGAEVLEGVVRGAVGGQVDYVRAANASAGGVSVIALPSVTSDGRSSIVARLQGPVSTARSDVRHVVTEQGVADLWGRTVRERVEEMVKIAHPDHRERLRAEIERGGGPW